MTVNIVATNLVNISGRHTVRRKVSHGPVGRLGFPRLSEHIQGSCHGSAVEQLEWRESCKNLGDLAICKYVAQMG